MSTAMPESPSQAHRKSRHWRKRLEPHRWWPRCRVASDRALFLDCRQRPLARCPRAVIAWIAYKMPEDLSEIPGSYELDAPSTDAL